VIATEPADCALPSGGHVILAHRRHLMRYACVSILVAANTDYRDASRAFGLTGTIIAVCASAF